MIETADAAVLGSASAAELAVAEEAAEYASMAPGALANVLKRLEKQMYECARNLEFEEAAALRDKIQAIRENRFGAASESG